MSEPRKYKRREVTPQEQARIDEVVRLLNVTDSVGGRSMARRVKTCFNEINRYKVKKKNPSKRMTERILEAYAEYAKEVTPRVNNEEGD